MIAARIIFWSCLLIAAYSYVLYPLLLLCLYALVQLRRDWKYLWTRGNRRTQFQREQILPAVSIIIPALNEEQHLPEKLANLERLDYPPDKIQVIFISDGSTDQTNSILKEASSANVSTVYLPERQGKAHALNEGVRLAKNEIVIFSDSSTLFAADALKTMVRHFAKSDVGVVCGSLLFVGSAESKKTEGRFWIYECAVRLMEARLGATLTASGAMYAIRKKCYREVNSSTLIEDFVIPMRARAQGFQVVYDPEAVATEYAASTVEGEFARRVRLSVGSFRALRELFNARMGAATRLAFISHKVLRWIVPFLLIGIMLSNVFLLSSTFYRAFFVAQACFYLWAVAGFLLRRKSRARALFSFGFYLVAMQAAFLVGFVRCITGRDRTVWQRVS